MFNNNSKTAFLNLKKSKFKDSVTTHITIINLKFCYFYVSKVGKTKDSVSNSAGISLKTQENSHNSELLVPKRLRKWRLQSKEDLDINKNESC